MSEIIEISEAIAGGFFLGILFFGGLWLTVVKSLISKRPWVWFLTSMVLRTSITLSGFYLLAGTSLKRLLLCSGGFIAARILVVMFTKERRQEESESCI
ncbi:MAG: ATP synthase subunit I [Chlorobiaceae bacterium]